jgi:hypothetical protein
MVRRLVFLLFLFLFLASCPVTVFGQKTVSVSVSTSTPVGEALRICKNVGELGWFYSLDYDEKIDSFSMLRHPLTPTTRIEVSAAVSNDKTALTFTLTERKGVLGGKTMGEHIKFLKSYTRALGTRLQNLEIGNFIALKE